MTEIKQKLFSEFPEVSTASWEEQINRDLKGKDYRKVLVWQSRDGINVNPYYRSESLAGLDYLNVPPGHFPYVRGNEITNNWLVRQEIKVTDPAEANRKALEILAKGVNATGFVFETCHGITSRDFQLLLDGIHLGAAEINLVCPSAEPGLLEAFVKYINEKKEDAGFINGSIDNDPLSRMMVNGKNETCCDEKLFFRLKDQIDMARSLPGFRTIAVNGKNFGNAGSSSVQELAYSLSMGAEYLNHLTGLGLTPDETAQRIKFNLSIGNNFFFEIARLRAGRLLWANIVKAYHPEDDCSCKMIVHAETGTFNKTVYDPYVNLLRTQTEAMSAALGGAHSVTVLPYDAAFRPAGDFSERIARNQQILLKEEANIDKITDAAGGSYYIESLTDAIADQAWKLFLEVEEKGGFLMALKEGFIQKQVKEMAARCEQNISSRRENLLGVNQFPNFSEVISEFPAPPVSQPADKRDPASGWDTVAPARAGQALELLRYRTDKFSKNHGRPKVFLLNIGDLVMRKARAQFSCNFFAVGGFEVIDNNGFQHLEEGISSARETGAKIVVICSSDEEYTALVPKLVELVDQEILVIAGNPPCRPGLEAIGVKNFIHVRSNLLEELSKYQNMLNI